MRLWETSAFSLVALVLDLYVKAESLANDCNLNLSDKVNEDPSKVNNYSDNRGRDSLCLKHANRQK